MKGGKWSEAILHLGARRNESAERSRNLANRETRNNLRRHVNLPNVWINNPIEYLTTEEVWAYLLQNPNPWGGDNKQLYRLYSNAAGGECPLVVDESTASCGNSRFGCWTCTVVERDKASEGLLESGDERMEQLIEFRKTLIEFRDPDNGWRDTRRMNGADGDGPLLMKGRKELLKRLLLLQEETGMVLVSDEELLLIQKYWKAARDPDDGRGVARIINKIKGVHMIDLKEVSRLQQLQEEVAAEKGICPDTLRRMLAKVEDYSESHKAMGLPDDLLNILKDAMKENELANKSD
jgi:DNA sulfur modification protein DndC